MNTELNVCQRIAINPNIKTAIIYSIDEIFIYLVEIRMGDKHHFISVNGVEPAEFGNLEGARQAALKEKVQKAYLALSKTYEENDLTTCHANHDDRYDYSPIPLYIVP